MQTVVRFPGPGVATAGRTTLQADRDDAAVLRAEAAVIESAHGPNAYSGFLVRHGRRPDRDQAATIGRLLGGRVMADDGTMQPPLSKAERQALRGIRSRRKAASRYYNDLIRLREAIGAIAECGDRLPELLQGKTGLIDTEELGSQVAAAITSLERFARDWHAKEGDPRPRSQASPGGVEDRDVP